MQGPLPRSPEDRGGFVNVLVIDPKPQSRSVLKGSLRGLNIIQSVLERSSPQDILQILQETPVHLVMIEQDLGGDDVFHVVQSVRQYPSIDKPRFILISQHHQPHCAGGVGQLLRRVAQDAPPEQRRGVVLLQI